MLCSRGQHALPNVHNDVLVRKRNFPNKERLNPLTYYSFVFVIIYNTHALVESLR
jgi:hypothetical protein